MQSVQWGPSPVCVAGAISKKQERKRSAKTGQADLRPRTAQPFFRLAAMAFTHARISTLTCSHAVFFNILGIGSPSASSKQVKLAFLGPLYALRLRVQDRGRNGKDAQPSTPLRLCRGDYGGKLASLAASFEGPCVAVWDRAFLPKFTGSTISRPRRQVARTSSVGAAPIP